MEEDTLHRTLATSHSLELDAEENLSKNARVARKVLHIRGEELKFDVNEEAWPNADLVIQSSYEGTLIDGLPADKAGDEREIMQMKDLQLYSDTPPEKFHSAHWLGTTDEGKQSGVAMCAEGFRDNGDSDAISCIGAWTLAVRNLLIFEWKLKSLCALSCRRTRFLKCMFDLQKVKSVKAGTEDHTGH